MAAATKVAALVVTLRLLVTAFPGEEELWTVALAVIVCFSLAWGNLAAIVQTNVKRLLAYSSISHAASCSCRSRPEANWAAGPSSTT